MTILLAGDIHGSLEATRFASRNFDATGLTRDDYLIILGDFGLVFDIEKNWHTKHAQRNEYWLDWLDRQPWTTLFVDGNHENHDRLAHDYPVTEWHGGKVHKIRKNVIHLMRGEIFEIDGLHFLAMGGAFSVDRDWRVLNESYWLEEVPSEDEKKNCEANLDKFGWWVDYVLTHDCPIDVMNEIGIRNNMVMLQDAYESWLQYIADKLDFRHWWFGHYHFDMPNIGRGGKYTCLYHQVYDLSEDNWSLRVRDNEPYTIHTLPKSRNELGYTIAEIAEMCESPVEDVERVMKIEMAGSTCGVDAKTGEILVYPHDLLDRILPMLCQSATLW